MKNSVRFPHLLQSSLLEDLPDDVKAGFLEAGAPRTYDQGETILGQGVSPAGAFLIAHGSVEITSFNPEGQTVLIHLYRQGEVFGDCDCLADKPAAANCVAANKAIMLFCPKSVLLEHMVHPAFVRNIMRVSYDRLVRDNTVKFVDQFYPVEQRLCDYLYRLSADRSQITKTQADLAGLLGCARQTLNRELGRLRDKGILEMEKGKIRIVDRPALLVQATTPHRDDT